MKVITYPELGWIGCHFVCPQCGVIVEFELSDLQGITPVKPKLIEGKWSAIVQCPVEGSVQTFREVQGGP